MAAGSVGGGLFDLMQQRLQWIGARQTVLARNLANADTPSYRPQDLVPFADHLTSPGVTLAVTNPNHIGPEPGSAALTTPGGAEHAPDGNAVSIEDQLMKVADTDNAQQLTSQLYTKYIAMYRVAIGKGS
jgi:flagellar basal-body rod protein FlgB